MQIPAGKYQRYLLYGLKSFLFLIIMWVVPFNLSGCPATNTINTLDKADIEIPLLEKWSGDYPVSELGRLPEGQQNTAGGYIGDSETFSKVWSAFMPGEILPSVDFSKSIVVFTRNVQFYNRTSIFKVELLEGSAEILAMETMSALPINEKVAMAMAIIPREGVKSIKAGTETIRVMGFK